MTKASSQKFIARVRPPRVQIEYDVETYGSQKKVQLPFVVGVMSDLAGNAAEPLAPVAERKMMEIDIDNFDDRLRSLRPRVVMRVPNLLTGEGQLAVDLTFERLEDFSPAAVARKVDSLSRLLEARTELSNLLAYMDGKNGAEELLTHFLADSALLSALGNGIETEKPDALVAAPPLASPDTEED
ncbi:MULTISPECIES: type VI secretion system contractile sheath small subunit [Rhizobium]|uniref:Type VI secretion system protein ImpB n=2 Tax=Rhizobium TaxID=379 RepID=A0A7W6QBH7_9HYPH|nr:MULTISPECIES: type VI secretion system contractile sheath small subunit [Rhizobium]ARO26875.1 hypothetical protein TAL182_PC00268 [Rhizobium sp. TAL182]MBB4194496.1 type VI secretion system protein ImpB [Rhizobium aethiopicum]MBB4582331.1 type VI secretion system protein ImpB [Rhizobium aethiopicum]PCD64235.1 type VI secretion system contractile sheath small subunit [Rhizobium phaseoli]PDS94230.1 type VI secretion system contractile sheath small subunit [Rhizobium sp. S9]